MVPILLVITGLAVYFFQRPHAFYGTAVDPPYPAQNFTLTSAAGPVSLIDFRGKLVVVYFGYTFCPDVCPATLAKLTQALKNLGAQAAEVQVLMVSLDPERDTPERLEEYLTSFDPSFIGITGTKEQLDFITAANGVFYEKISGSSPDNYSIDHTASLLVFDRELSLVLLIPFETTPNQVADDLKYLLK
jgi:protein SCO1/2